LLFKFALVCAIRKVQE